ncbi:MAG: choice-of-anchor J domain-containing protein [Candidatus Marinimicrobia bacterium]|nr:choice-of-anchor J domain-containing protein [Candidatus Neomarinimicrobiota bacterium]
MTLANSFIFNGKPRTVTLYNLTPGATYETNLFAWGYDDSGTARAQTFASGSDSLELDQNFYGQNNGIRIAYTFVADSSEKVLTITPVGDNTFHMSALANRQVLLATILNFGTNVAGSSAVFGLPVGGAATIDWTVPYASGSTPELLTTLAPSFTLSSGDCTDQTSGEIPSPAFPGPVTYTVTDGGITNVYTVTVHVAPASTDCNITAFDANLAVSSAVITPTGDTTGTVVVHVPYGTTAAQVVALAPSYTLSAFATCPQPNPGVPSPDPLSLTTPVHYIVTAQSGATKDYTVTVTVAGPPLPFMALTGDGTAQGYSDWEGEYDGFRFVTGPELRVVNWLGFYDAPLADPVGTLGDGLAASHVIQLWRVSDWTKIAETTIAEGTAETLSGSFRGHEVPEVTLMANTTYALVAAGGGGDRIREGDGLSGWSQLGITINGGCYGYGGQPDGGWGIMVSANLGYMGAPAATYETWAAANGIPGEPDTGDFDHDGLANGIEFVVGGNPTLNDTASVAPSSSTDGAGLVFTFRRTDLANNDLTATIVVEYGSDLAGWTPAEPDVDGVTIVENPDFYDVGIGQVIVTLPSILAVDGRLFARLKVTITPPVSLLDEDFEAGDGGFTIVTTGGTPWAHGDPESPDAGGGEISEGNDGSANCWGTNLTGVYAASTDASLRSPVIDLTAVTGATLSFARAFDAAVDDTLEVNVLDTTGNLIAVVIAPFGDPDVDTTPWKTISVPIPAGALGQQVRIEWRFIGNEPDAYLGVYIDDVVVTAP